MLRIKIVFFSVMLLFWTAFAESQTLMQPGSSTGTKHTAKKIVSSKNIAVISYPISQLLGNQSKSKNGKWNQIQAIELSEPSRIEEEGLYLWRDNHDIWHLKRVSDTEFKFSGEIRSEIKIDPVQTNGTLNTYFELSMENDVENTVKLRASGIPGWNEAPVRFKTKSEYFDFNVVLEGVAGSHQIYIGSSCLIPLIVPFHLEIQSAGYQINVKEVIPTIYKSDFELQQGDSDENRKASSGGSAGGMLVQP